MRQSRKANKKVACYSVKNILIVSSKALLMAVVIILGTVLAAGLMLYSTVIEMRALWPQP